jgi:hypothetical protein
LWQDLENLRAEAKAVSTVVLFLERTYLESKVLKRGREETFDTQT